jgi:ribonuclease-3
MNWLKKIAGLFSPAASMPAADLKAVQDLVGYHFRDETLLKLALTHRSYSHSSETNEQSNERLEFLGDSILGLVISEQLYQDHPDLREGELTKTKALLVNETTLALLGRKAGLNSHVLLAPEEARSGGAERPSIISDAVEAVIGAVFLDGGLDYARDVILRLIYLHKKEILSDDSQRNFKGELLEQMQARGDSPPRYDVLSADGPDHQKIFNVIVYAGQKVLGEGAGPSKKEAEQRAAAKALESGKS